MITYKDLSRHAKALLEFCEYPAVEYKVKFSILDVPYEDRALSLLRKAFWKVILWRRWRRRRTSMVDGENFNQKIIL